MLKTSDTKTQEQTIRELLGIEVFKRLENDSTSEGFEKNRVRFVTVALTS